MQGEHRMKVLDGKDMDEGSNFTIFCNVTMDIGHMAKIIWLKDVSHEED